MEEAQRPPLRAVVEVLKVPMTVVMLDERLVQPAPRATATAQVSAMAATEGISAAPMAKAVPLELAGVPAAPACK
jgi:hypothetical protein